MQKHSSPLVGFNNNVKHKGRIFHVQTEDSGVARPRIVTHLFADGGRIIQSTKTDYSEHVGRKDMVAVVRRLMKEQHKAMFIALRDGQFDDAIAEVYGSDEAPADRAPESGTQRPSVPPRRSTPPPTLHDVPVPDISGISQEEVERAAAAAAEPVPRRPAPTLTEFTMADLGAPPEHTTHEEETLAGAVARQKVGATPPPAKGTPVQGTPAIAPPPRSGRYAASRPAAIFSEQTRPKERGASLFGTSPISEQSLDEVILSYLAEDLEGPASEK